MRRSGAGGKGKGISEGVGGCDDTATLMWTTRRTGDRITLHGRYQAQGGWGRRRPALNLVLCVRGKAAAPSAPLAERALARSSFSCALLRCFMGQSRPLGQ